MKAKILKRYTFKSPSNCIQIIVECPYKCKEKYHKHGLTEIKERNGENLILNKKVSDCNNLYIPYYETINQAKYDFDNYTNKRWNFKN